MKKLLGLLALFMLASLPAMAQYSGPRLEVNGGYTYTSYDAPGGGPRVNFNGWDAGVGFNVNGWLSAAGDFDGSYARTRDGVALYLHVRATDLSHGPPQDHTVRSRAVRRFARQHSLEHLSRIMHSAGRLVEASTTRSASTSRSGWPRSIIEQTQNFQPGPNQNNFKYKGGIVFRF